MTALDTFIFFIFFIKIIFIILVIIGKITLHKNNEVLYRNVMVLKDKFENIFLLSVSLLCMYVFFPRRKIPLTITFEMQLLFFVYGILVLIDLIVNSTFVQSKKNKS